MIVKILVKKRLKDEENAMKIRVSKCMRVSRHMLSRRQQDDAIKSLPAVSWLNKMLFLSETTQTQFKKYFKVHSVKQSPNTST